MKIQNSNTEIRVEEKRFYPPFTISDICPNCNEECFLCGPGLEYLSYPWVNKPFKPTFYCGHCDDEKRPCEWEGEPIVIRVTAEIANEQG